MDVFQALAEPTRRNIVEILAASGQLSASDIYSKFPVSPPAISQHLKVLRDANVVTVEKKAQKRLYQINPQKMTELEVWAKKMQKVWDVRFDRLGIALNTQQQKQYKKLHLRRNNGRSK